MLSFLSSVPLNRPIDRFHVRKSSISPPRRDAASPLRATGSPPKASLPVRLDKLCAEIRQQPDQKTRLLRLAFLSQSMPKLSETTLTPTTRVKGCTSVTHVSVTRASDDTLQLRGYSDAVFAGGFLSLLVLGLDGATATEATTITASEILAAAALTDGPAASRLGGLPAILDAIQKHLFHTDQAPTAKDTDRGGGTPATKELLSGRWTERQGEDVAVLLSGGVDSSVAMHLAMESGARVQAFYLKIWLDDETAHLGSCPWEEDMHFARAVCHQAGVELHDVPFQQAYWDHVVSYTVNEARHGRTPNPDVMCNTRVKFGAFYDLIGSQFSRVVTGHYARRTTSAVTGLAELRLSQDAVKDQTYFLAHVGQEQLQKAWFPLGDLEKSRVRELAHSYDLANKTRRDSQGICFLGKLKFDEFLGHHLGERHGQLVEFETGRELGAHRGFWFFTVGQRRGIGLSGGPWHVMGKDVDENIVYVSRDYDSEDKERRWFDFEDATWVSGEWPYGLGRVGDVMRLRVKTRHGAHLHEGTVTRTGLSDGRVQLGQRDKGLAAGQFVVFYDGEGRCVGCGRMSSEESLKDAPSSIIAMDERSVRLQAHL